jgi:RHS repeat-associated protein
MSARVTNANGRIIAEKRNGQRRYHQHDALGNTIALIDDAGTVTNTFSYWPYGELRTSVIGNLPTPFLYCGQWGYYTDTTGRIYVRARTYRPVFTRWLTVDPLWPTESSYIYALLSPSTRVDWSGYGVFVNECRCQRCINGVPGPSEPQRPFIREAVRTVCQRIASCKRDPKCLKKWADCIDAKPGYGGWPGVRMLTCMYNVCMGNTFNVHVDCNTGFSCSKGDFCAVTSPGSPCKIQICASPQRTLCGHSLCATPNGLFFMPRYATCHAPACVRDNSVPLDFTLLHELTHCCGMPHGSWGPPDHGDEVVLCLP